MEVGLKGIREYAFELNKILNIYMNDNIYYIGKYAFGDNSNLKTINNIPANLKVIGDDVFYAGNLDEETIETIKKINPKALYYAYASASIKQLVKYDYDMKLKPISDTFFSYTDDTQYDIYIPSIGQYVNYTYDANGTGLSPSESGIDYGYGISQTNGMKWRIFNINDETGKVELISEKATNEVVRISDAVGYNNAVYLMNHLCEVLYSNRRLGITARSINLKDFESNFTEAALKLRNENSEGYGNSQTYYSYMGYPTLYAQQKGGGIDISYIAQPELTIDNPDPYEESDPINTSTTTEQSMYPCESLTVTKTGYSMPINSTYFGEAAKFLSSDSKYFVAARSTDLSDYYPLFGVRVASDTLDRERLYRDWSYCGSEYDNQEPEEVTGKLHPIVTIDSSMLKSVDSNGNWNLQ